MSARRSLEFHRFSLTTPNAVEFAPDALVIAGWTGRDRAAVEHHIEELARVGVPRPSQTPLYYRVSASRLTQEDAIQALGDASSGEAEPVLLSMNDGLFLGLGSDHTDRHVEAYSVAVSKQLCAKPLSRVLWDCREIVDYWDRLIVRSFIDDPAQGGKRVLYQEGALGQIAPPKQLIQGYDGAVESDNPEHAGRIGLPVGTVMFLGTFAALGGVRSAPRFEMQLHDPVRKRTISHSYQIDVLPVVN